MDSRLPQKKKFIDSLSAFLIATACIGPLALPLLWRNPHWKRSTKIWGTIAVLAFTVALIAGSFSIVSSTLEVLKELESAS